MQRLAGAKQGATHGRALKHGSSRAAAAVPAAPAELLRTPAELATTPAARPAGQHTGTPGKRHDVPTALRVAASWSWRWDA